MKRSETLLLLVLALFLIPWVRTMALSGIDFEVYHEAALALRLGEDPFDLTRFGHRVYKYPPWILPLFLPLSFLSLGMAKWVWALLNGLLSVDLFRRLSSGGPRALPFLLVVIAYPLGMVHSIVGQVSILLLWMWVSLSDSSWNWLIWVLSSAKITTLYAPLLILGRHKGRVKSIVFAVASAGVLMAGFTLMRDAPILEVFRAWSGAAGSGKELGLEVLGRENQGFPALFVRAGAFFFPSLLSKVGTPALLSMISGILFVCFLGFLRKSLSDDREKRLGAALLVCAMLQPLAWFHVFLWCLPALAKCFRAALRPLAWKKVLGLSVAALCISGLTQKTVGEDLGGFLEFISIKSWGCALLLWLLLRAGKNQAYPSILTGRCPPLL